MIVNVSGGRTHEEEKEPDRDRNLEDRLQQNCLMESHKCHARLVQEAHTACRKSRHISKVSAVSPLICLTEVESFLPTRTTVASALSGIFSINFTSCLDLE